MRLKTFTTKLTANFIQGQKEAVSIKSNEKPPGMRPVLLLVAGGVLIFLGFLRYGMAEFGWIVFAPLLLYVQQYNSWKQHLALLASLVIAFLFTVSKIITDGIPWMAVPMYAIPIAISYFLMLALAGAAHRKLGLGWGLYSFAAMAVVMGWIQYSFTPAASWGILAHTQADNLPLVQLCSLTGVGGITFLVALGSGLLAGAWSSGLRVVRSHILVFGGLMASVLLFGQLRLAQPSPGAMIRMGGIVSPVTRTDFVQAARQTDFVRPKDNELFARSEHAVALGARMVAWNEVATIVSEKGEPALAARGQSFARNNGVLLLMAYAVILSNHPLYYVNKYRIYLPDGTLADEYLKRHPVPGDPHGAGKAHARVIRFNGINVSGGICYDYSFPGVARDNAREGADLAMVPSSDWHGIDPLHGLMARMNAVAAGLPMIRPVRDASSIACDAYGRVLGSMPADGPGDGVLVEGMQGSQVHTVYSRTGEIFPIVAFVFCGLVLVLLLTQSHVVRR